MHVQAAAKKGMTVVAGKGDEGDTLRDRTIFVYDTTQFPFRTYTFDMFVNVYI